MSLMLLCYCCTKPGMASKFDLCDACKHANCGNDKGGTPCRINGWTNLQPPERTPAAPLSWLPGQVLRLTNGLDARELCPIVSFVSICRDDKHSVKVYGSVSHDGLPARPAEFRCHINNIVGVGPKPVGPFS